MIKIGIGGIALTMLSACGNGTPDYDATGTFEATEVIVSAEAAGKLLNLDIEEGKRLQTGEEIGLVDTLQLYLKKLQLEANMKSVESQRPDLAKQIAATKQQIATAEREKKRVENLLTAGAANSYAFQVAKTVTSAHTPRNTIPNSRSCRNDVSIFFNDLNSMSSFCFLSDTFRTFS